MQKRNISKEQVEIALPMLKAGIRPSIIAEKYGINRLSLVRLCTNQRKKGVAIPRWYQSSETNYGTLKQLMVSAGPAALSWAIDQTPDGATVAETIGAILADVAAEDKANAKA